MALSSTIINSRLWQISLGDSFESGLDDERQRLKNAFESFRENANVLASEIARDLPDFTVHEETHLDALWEMASQIAGENVDFNPVEAFVFGGAVLLHDLGMASVAYINGVEDLKKGDEWEDALEYVFRQRYGRPSTKEDNKFEDEKLIKVAIESRLRLLHAHQAEKLCFIEWESREGITNRLLNDTHLLEHLGEIIGKIAASHCWPIEKVESDLKRKLGSPSSYPANWDVDCLKIACLLRCADAAHIDNRRAPSLLKMLRKPTGVSHSHWTFQNKLSRPVLENDLLVYNSSRSFNEDDVESWWIAYDTIRMIDNEIKNVNTTLKNNGRKPFKAYGVKGANNVDTLSEHIQTHDWEPVNLDVKISNVSQIVKHLGGTELYGDFKYVPLREAIQNAVDAIEAKRRLHGLDDTFGKIVVSYGEDADGRWMDIADNGIGMSKRVITEKLLDFGSSYWQSSLMMDEHVGLLAKGFKSIGRYGLGFFSLFMLGDISLSTRSIHAGPEGTFILQVNKNLNHKPILKKAKRPLQMMDSGTKIRIHLEEGVSLMDIVKSLTIFSPNEDNKIEGEFNQLSFILRKIAPTLSVDLYLKIDKEVKIIGNNDWKTIDNKDLISRLVGFEYSELPTGIKDNIDFYQHLLAPIYNKSGDMVARLGIMPSKSYKYSLKGTVTCGGLISANTTEGIVGVLLGDVISANRHISVPLVELDALKEWAETQREMFEELGMEFNLQCRAASIVNLCGGDTGNLFICKMADGEKSFNDLSRMDLAEEIIIADSSLLSVLEGFDENVIIFGSISGTFIDIISLTNINPWPLENEDLYATRGERLLINAISSKGNPDYKNEEYFFADKHTERVLGINKYGEEVKRRAKILNKNIDKNQ